MNKTKEHVISRKKIGEDSFNIWLYIFNFWKTKKNDLTAWTGPTN